MVTGAEAPFERAPIFRGVIRMDDRLYKGRQASHTGPVGIGHIQPEKIHHALVEESRLAICRQAPDMARNHVNELREIMLPIAQSRFGSFGTLSMKHRFHRLLLPSKLVAPVSSRRSTYLNRLVEE